MSIEKILCGYKGVLYSDGEFQIFKLYDDNIQKLIGEDKIKQNIKHELMFQASQLKLKGMK